MSRAEDRALELYPIESGEVFDANGDIYESDDKNYAERFAYIKGYQQAEKDLELSWEDIETIQEMANKYCKHHSCEPRFFVYSEVLKRFKTKKEK